MNMPLRISLLFAFGLLALGGIVLHPELAFAIGDDAKTAAFSCSGGKATGQLYATGASCPTTLSTTNFFSFLICNMEQLSSNVMGHMYCGMIKSLESTVWAAVTLAIVIFGVSFTIGLTSLSRGGALLFLIKIAFVTAFATNADYLIGVAYKFFISGISDGVSIVLSKGDNSNLKSGSDVYKMMDNFIKTAFKFATDYMAAPPAQGTDAAAAAAAATAARCKNAVFAVLVTMTAAFPLITYLGLALIIRIAITFFKAAFGYVYALVGITFLMVLAPIFLSFYLFKETSRFFEKWLGYLVSFTLQIILLFAFLTFILSLNVQSLTKNLPDIIMFNAKAMEGTAFRLPWEYCTFCDFKIVDKDSGEDLPAGSNDLLTKGKLQCKKYPASKDGADSEGRKPTDITFAMSPKAKTAELSPLVELAGKGILSLIIMAWIVERLLNIVPVLAQRLASNMGGSYSPQLGGTTNSTPGGVVSPSVPGEGLMRDFKAGFDRGFGTVAYGGTSGVEAYTGKIGSGPSATMQGVKDGMAMMTRGRMTEIKEGDKVVRAAEEYKGAGIAAGFQRWLTNPGRYDR